MDELVSRQAVLVALKDALMAWSYMPEWRDEKIIEAIAELPPEPHWNSVEQDLPKIGEYVLCGTTTPYFGKYHVCKFVDKDKWIDKPHFDWDRNGFPHVVAWTRFRPYKGVTE